VKEIQYKTFSWRTHKKNWGIKNPNVCQFELTFKCDLHCKHCYTDCYNKPARLKKELNTKEIKLILDKIHKTGAIWLCFTGGDPLTREDFLDIYSYAKDKGFIVTVFTNGYSMSREIAQYFRKRPPFVIEMTLNAVTEDVYEKISQVSGSFAKVTQGIDLILKAKLSLKIKTQVIRDNLEELAKIKKFIEGFGLKSRPSTDLYARLDADVTPCNLRISSQEVLSLSGKAKTDCLNQINASSKHNKNNKISEPNGRNESGDYLFRCAIGGGDGINIDPYGNTFLCNLIRKPAFNLLKLDVKYAQNKLLSLVRGRKFTTGSKCRGCQLREFCLWCPGRAYLEIGNMEAPVDYYCQLAKTIAQRRGLKNA